MTVTGEIGVIAKPDPLALPTLEAGETYVATLFDAANGKGYHLILLPGDNDQADWETQAAWAQSIGGELPTRVEQSLLYAQCKSLFEEVAYWVNNYPVPAGLGARTSTTATRTATTATTSSALVPSADCHSVIYHS